jgi:hypothetical protein
MNNDSFSKYGNHFSKRKVTGYDGLRNWCCKKHDETLNKLNFNSPFNLNIYFHIPEFSSSEVFMFVHHFTVVQNCLPIFPFFK